MSPLSRIVSGVIPGVYRGAALNPPVAVVALVAPGAADFAPPPLPVAPVAGLPAVAVPALALALLALALLAAPTLALLFALAVPGFALLALAAPVAAALAEPDFAVGLPGVLALPLAGLPAEPLPALPEFPAPLPEGPDCPLPTLPEFPEPPAFPVPAPGSDPEGLPPDEPGFVFPATLAAGVLVRGAPPGAAALAAAPLGDGPLTGPADSGGAAATEGPTSAAPATIVESGPAPGQATGSAADARACPHGRMLARGAGATAVIGSPLVTPPGTVGLTGPLAGRTNESSPPDGFTASGIEPAIGLAGCIAITEPSTLGRLSDTAAATLAPDARKATVAKAPSPKRRRRRLDWAGGIG